MNHFWNDRYSDAAYVYGEEPNVFFASQLNELIPGTLVLPCEGEGRNAVFAASQGWKVHAFDSSEAGKAKALLLAQKNAVQVDYVIDDAGTISYPANNADVVAFIYAHFSPSVRKLVHQKAISWLKPGGKIILEAFTPAQLQNNSGGPKELAMLYTKDMIQSDFKALTIESLQTTQTILAEGKYHAGKADILRFIGIKK